jgi:hypothetical protein
VALLEVVEASQGRVTDLRHELDRAREALDRTDAVLTTADSSLVKAEAAIVNTPLGPRVFLVIGGVALAGVAAIVVPKRRGSGRPRRGPAHLPGAIAGATSPARSVACRLAEDGPSGNVCWEAQMKGCRHLLGRVIVCRHPERMCSVDDASPSSPLFGWPRGAASSAAASMSSVEKEQRFMAAVGSGCRMPGSGAVMAQRTCSAFPKTTASDIRDILA